MRRAWRSAQRLGTDLDLLWVKPPGKPIEGEEERQVTALRQLASVLGATLLIEEHDDLVAAVARVVRERGSTYIMVGESDPPRGLARLREPLPQRLMRATPPGVDVRIVAHRGLKEERAVIEHFLVGVALLLGLGGGFLIARSRLRGRRSASGPTRSTRSSSPSPAPRSPAAPLDAALRLARAEDATLMPAYLAAGAEEPAARVLDPQRGGAGDVDAGGDRTARHRPGRRRSTPGSSAAAPTATRSSACWSEESFDRVVVPAHATGARRASPATTSSGCCERPRPRC